MNLVITLILFAPFIFILLLANLADQRRGKGISGTELAGLSYGLLIFLYVMLILFGLILQLLGLAAQATTAAEVAVNRDLVAALGRVGPALWIPSLIGIGLLLPVVRRLVARMLPIDPASTVHAVSLSFTMLVLINLGATVGIGLGNLADMLQGVEPATVVDTASALWAQALVWIIMSLVGVGWLTRRSLHETQQRLGIVTPTLRQAAMGLAGGAGMAVLITIGMTILENMGLSNQEVDRLSELLVGPLTQSPLGVLSLGLAAGIGEETLLRGAIQPRFGLLLTAFLFALLHSQYGLSIATVVVFLVGLVLGLLRQRANTSTAMICHAAYNISLVLLSLA